MALGFLSKKASDSSSPAPSTEKANPEFGKGYYGDYAANQSAAENGGKKPRRKMNRIDKPVTKSISGDLATADDSTDASDAIGKQMEMEAGNAIKYRTCSWQKV